MEDENRINLDQPEDMPEKRSLRPALVALIIFLALAVAVGLFVKSKSSKVPKNDQEAVEIFNRDLIKKSNAYVKNKKEKTLAQMVDLSKQRQEKMITLIQNNPTEALKVTLNSETRDNLPSEIQDNIESEVTLTGQLQVTHIDDFENNKSIPMDILFATGGGEYHIYPTKESSPGFSGSQVEVKGTNLKGLVALDGNNHDSIKKSTNSVLGVQTVSDIRSGHSGEVLSAATGQLLDTSTIGELKTLVIHYTYSNYPQYCRAPFYNIDNVRNKFFTELSNYIREFSYGKAWLGGNVVCVVLPYPTGTVTFVPRNEILKAADPFVNFNNYTYIVTGTCCIGGASKPYLTDDGLVKLIIYEPGMQNLKVMAHELGHSLGLVNHSNKLRCGSNPPISHFAPD